MAVLVLAIVAAFVIVGVLIVFMFQELALRRTAGPRVAVHRLADAFADEVEDCREAGHEVVTTGDGEDEQIGWACRTCGRHWTVIDRPRARR